MLSKLQQSVAIRSPHQALLNPNAKARQQAQNPGPTKGNGNHSLPTSNLRDKVSASVSGSAISSAHLPQNHKVPSAFPPAQKRLVSTPAWGAWGWRAQKPYWAPMAAVVLLLHKAERRMLKLGLQDGVALLINTIKAAPAISKQWYN